MFSDFDKALYKDLFDRFSQEEYHVDFYRDQHPDDYEKIVSSLYRLQDGQVLFVIGEDDSSITGELTPSYCFDFQDL